MSRKEVEKLREYLDAAVDFRFKDARGEVLARVYQGPGYIDRPWTIESGRKLAYAATKEEALEEAKRIAAAQEIALVQSHASPCLFHHVCATCSPRSSP